MSVALLTAQQSRADTLARANTKIFMHVWSGHRQSAFDGKNIILLPGGNDERFPVSTITNSRNKECLSAVTLQVSGHKY